MTHNNLHTQAQHLKHLHIQLDTLKTTQQTKPGAGNKRCAPGPRTPGNTWAIDTSVEYTARLFEYVRDAANHLTPSRCFTHNPIKLLDYIAFNAALIEPLGMHDDLLHEINTQITVLEHHLNPTPITPTQDTYLTARSINLTMRRFGIHINPKTLATWANRGHITKRINPKGQATYNLAQIKQHLEITPENAEMNPS